ncbi:hypothetical protein LDENG_00273880 [Lucifuga dentata]|nr:hypothetical protein LDENG_00273880 [Lucifuga dentata]
MMLQFLSVKYNPKKELKLKVDSLISDQLVVNVLIANVLVANCFCSLEQNDGNQFENRTSPLEIQAARTNTLKGLYQLFCMFEPNIFSFHTCNITDNHFQSILLER